MKTSIFIIFVLTIMSSSYAASCKKQLRDCTKMVRSADKILDKAINYYEHHEKFIYKRNFTMAKQYLDLSIESIETAITKYDVAKTELEKTFENCRRNRDKISELYIKISEVSEDIKFQKIILNELSSRL